MSSRRLEDRVRDLCAKVVGAKDSEIEQTLKELRQALAEHNRRLRKMAAQKLTGQEHEERRSP
jgi:uncharacterized coiled-coil protein SlyX